MLFLILFCFFSSASATSVLYLEGSNIEHTLKNDSLVHVSFPVSCERNCKATFVFEAADIDVRILTIPFAKSNLMASVENSAALTTTNEIRVDQYTISVYEETYKIIEKDLATKKVIVLTIISSSLEGKFAELVGNNINYNFWELSVGFPVMVQRVRLWQSTFFFPFYFAGLCLLFFLTWPLQRKRAALQTIVRTLALLSLVAWLIDAFYAGFVVSVFSSERKLSSFLLHVFGNACFVIILVSTEGTQARALNITLAVLTLLTNGGGFFICPALLFVDMLLLERRTGRERGKYSSIICKQV